MRGFVRPGPQARQFSGRNAQHETCLAVVGKCTYAIRDDGRCTPAQEQLPIHLDSVQHPDHPLALLHDTDLMPFKRATDVIIHGHAYSKLNQVRLEAEVRIGKTNRRLSVVGDRSVTRTATGQLIFSAPKPIDKIPLCFSRAYGGCDKWTEARVGGNPAEMMKSFFDEPLNLAAASPFNYPRNPAGRGYLIEDLPEALEQVQLPNLEDPDDLLTPERLIAGGIGNWPKQPVPGAFGWVDYNWFPRVAYLGIVPEYDPPPEPLFEIRRGWVPNDVLAEFNPTAQREIRYTNGAAYGMQFPFLQGNETVDLLCLHEKHPRLRFTLPDERPKMWTDGRKGGLKEATPALHTVFIEPDAMRVTLTWVGTAPALRPYLDPELEKMPFRVSFG